MFKRDFQWPVHTTLLSCETSLVFQNSMIIRSDHWWCDIVMRTFTDRDWLENFRMSKETFNYLCHQMSTSLRRQDTVFRKAISVEKRVAVTLWFLATPCEYRTISHLFGIARSTVCEIVQETCSLIVSTLFHKYISFPTGDKLTAVVDAFKSKWGVPQCVGSIDGCHIPISSPAMNRTDYYNRKGWYSMILQGVVDDSYRFIDINVGWPGSVHDARVFAQSSIFKKISEGTLLPDQTTTVNGVNIPLYLIGDSAYPIKSWLMKPFTHGTVLTTEQKTFNYRLCRARIVIENAYGRLKARWRRVMKRNDMNIANIPTVITAACILHNICEVHGDTFNDSWLREIRDSSLPQPSSSNARDGNSTRPNQIRDALCYYFSN